MALRIGFAPWGETIDELVAAARAAEAAGADTLWVSELHRSATVVAAAVAAGTDRARVGTGIALGFARSPVITALETLDLAELASGRFVLGLGTGTRRVVEEWHHRPFDRPATRLAEVIRAIRGFWAGSAAGDDIVIDGEFEPVRIAGYRRPYPVSPSPIVVAAVGPAMVRLAGRHGDGWLAHELCSPRYVRERVLPELAAGWGEPGRPDGFEVIASVCCSVDDDPDVAGARVAGHVGFYATVRSYADFFDFHGVGAEAERISAEFRATRVAPPASAEMSDLLTASGDADAVAARIMEYDGVADSVKLGVPVNGLAPDEIRAAQASLIDLIGRITA